MSDKASFLSRLGSWFGRTPRIDKDLPLLRQTSQSSIEPARVSRGSFLFRPWARRDAALASVHQAFTTLTALMSSVRESLEKQNRRQDDLIRFLALLPESLQSIPDSNRMSAETIKSIQRQIEHQTAHQKNLVEILDRIGDSASDQRDILDSLHDRISSLHQHDGNMAQTMQNISTAMESVTRSSDNTAQVLEQLRDALASRDWELEQVLYRQNQRFALIMAVAILLSVASLIAVAVMGYVMWTKLP